MIIMKNLFRMPQEISKFDSHYIVIDPMIIDKPQKGKSCLAVITTWKNTRKLPCCMSLHMYELCQPQKEQKLSFTLSRI